MWLLNFLSKLPLGLLYSLSRPLYFVAYYVIGFRKGIVYSNIRNSFPDKSPTEITRIAKQSYKNFVIVFFEMLKANTISKEEIARRVRIANPELIRQYIQNNQSIILLAAHQCNWEWMLLATCLEIPSGMDAVYKPLHVDTFEKFFFRARSRFGGNPIPVKNFIFEIMKRKDQSKGFAMVADQTPLKNEEKYWRRFLNQDTAFFVGAQKIAALIQSPVIFAAMQREKLGYYTVTLKLLAQPPYSKEGYDIVERYAQETEQQVLSSPADWLWLYRKWKYKKPLYD